MSLNKAVVVCVLALATVTVFAQSAPAPVTDADTITLDEYANALALKLKQQQSQGSASSSKTGAMAPASGEVAVKPRKVVAPNPFDGWTYNGATLDALTKQALFGEMIVAGQRRVVYSGDVLAQTWRVATLTVRAIEFKNVACEMPTNPSVHRGRKPASKARQEQMCEYRLARKV